MHGRPGPVALGQEGPHHQMRPGEPPQRQHQIRRFSQIRVEPVMPELDKQQGPIRRELQIDQLELLPDADDEDVEPLAEPKHPRG